uniref:Autophagy_act_C domain-containing protein n=1 Tax=Strongyloides venezuelensis TaxID=75913 RepID=A0A0K0G4M3_STRVS
MVTITLEEYSDQLKKLIDVLNGYTNQHWSLINNNFYPIGKFEDTVFGKNCNMKMRRVIEIHYDVIYSLPKIWFNFYSEDWKRLSTDEVFNSGCINEAILIQLKSIPTFVISSGENPITNLPFYHFHACKTEEVIKRKKTFLLRWLSFFGMYLGLNYDILFLTELINSYSN